jgi:hypothetical protein
VTAFSSPKNVDVLPTRARGDARTVFLQLIFRKGTSDFGRRQHFQPKKEEEEEIKWSII